MLSPTLFEGVVVPLLSFSCGLWISVTEKQENRRRWLVAFRSSAISSTILACYIIVFSCTAWLFELKSIRLDLIVPAAAVVFVFALCVGIVPAWIGHRVGRFARRILLRENGTG